MEVIFLAKSGESGLCEVYFISATVGEIVLSVNGLLELQQLETVG